MTTTPSQGLTTKKALGIFAIAIVLRSEEHTSELQSQR